VAEPEGFEAEVAALADRLAALAPLAVARVKANVALAEAGDFAAVLRREAEGMIALAATDDFKEGLAAFTERRSPVFRGT
jgi:enoyl-CoA hydratase/carnithine racemase